MNQAASQSNQPQDQGWYVGTTYTDEDDGFVGPGSRDSGYYATRQEAERALALICQGRLATRRHP